MKKFMLILTLTIYPVLGQGEWEFGPSLPYGVGDASIVMVNQNQVIYAGGYGGPEVNYEVVNFIQSCYFPENEEPTCEVIAELPFVLYMPVIVDLKNGCEVMVTGGLAMGIEEPVRLETYIINYLTNTWRYSSPIHLSRNAAYGTLLSDGKVLIAFGADGNYNGTTYEIWDPETEEWFYTGFAEQHKQMYQMIVRDGQIYAVGGDTTITRFNEETYAWEVVVELPYLMQGFGLTLNQANNFLMVGGNYQGSYSYFSYIINPDSDEITMIDSVNIPCLTPAIFCLENQDCYKVGGQNSSLGYIGLEQVELLRNSEWIQLDDMPNDFSKAYALRLTDGRYLVTGNNRFSEGAQLLFSWNSQPSINTFQYSPEPSRSSVMVEASDPNQDSIKVCLYWHEYNEICSPYQESGSIFEFDINYEWGALNAQVFDIWSENNIHNSCSPIVELVLLSNNDIKTPTEFKLNQNYPNPFNPKTTISYELVTAGKVLLVICDLRGKQVAELVNSYQLPGTYQLTWQAPLELASGMYILQLITDSGTDFKSIMLLK